MKEERPNAKYKAEPHGSQPMIPAHTQREADTFCLCVCLFAWLLTTTSLATCSLSCQHSRLFALLTSAGVAIRLLAYLSEPCHVFAC